MELHKQAGMADDLLAGTNSLKRRWRKRNVKLNSVEKKLLLPAKGDSTDEEECDESVMDDMSVDEESVSPDYLEDLGKAAMESPNDTSSSDKAKGQAGDIVYAAVEKIASSPSHNPTHECTVKAVDSKNEASLAKDGHNFDQEVGKDLEQQIHTSYYVSVDRLPEIQVNIRFTYNLTFLVFLSCECSMCGLQMDVSIQQCLKCIQFCILTFYQ